MRKRHEMECEDDDCFCMRAGKELNEFIREYIQCQLTVLAEQFHNTPSVLLSILYFKMVLFKLYPEILTKIGEYRNRFSFSVVQRFECYWLTDYVNEYIRHRNQEIDAIYSEDMFELEAIRVEMIGIIRREVESR